MHQGFRVLEDCEQVPPGSWKPFTSVSPFSKGLATLEPGRWLRLCLSLRDQGTGSHVPSTWQQEGTQLVASERKGTEREKLCLPDVLTG